MDKASLLTFITAMITILNPIGNIAIFAGMVTNSSATYRRKVAIKCAISIAVILVGTVWFGEFILNIFGVKIPSLQVAGGIIIGSISLSMLHGSQSGIHDSKKDKDNQKIVPEQDIAIVPLAMPMIAGPGAIVTIIVNTHSHRGFISNLEMSVVCIALAFVIAIGFLSTKQITRLLGAKGMDIVTKFMGIILLAIASSMFAEGAKGLLPGLGS